jgi:predicted transcriptional regulator
MADTDRPGDPLEAALDPPTAPRPTDGELEILTVLWQQGESSVREVQEALDRSDPARRRGYTTVLKLMQIMAEKGLLERDESQRAHLYRPAVSQQATQGALLDHLLDRAFGGSASQLVMRALSHRAADADELAQVRRLLDEVSRSAGAASGDAGSAQQSSSGYVSTSDDDSGET